MLNAAAQEFIAQGYAATSLSSVAGRLGLTKGALAHHFPTKDELLVGLGEALHTAFVDSDTVSRAAYPDSGMRAAIAFLVQLGGVAAKNVQVAAALVLLTDRGTPPNVYADLTFIWLDKLAEFIVQAQKLGEVRAEVDPKEAAEFLLATNIGSTLLPDRSPVPQNRRKRLRFIRLGMQSLSSVDANAIVDEVLLSGYIDVPATNPPIKIPGAVSQH